MGNADAERGQKMKQRLMSLMTWLQITDYLKNTVLPGVIIPIGPMEEHGPHLPIGTDYLNAEKVSLMVAERSGCLVYPTIPLMYCGIGSDCIGSYGVSPETLVMLASDITYKLAMDGFKKILWGTGHGGRSMTLVKCGIQNAKKLSFMNSNNLDFDSDCFDHLVGNRWKEIVVVTESDGHAGEIETSAVLYMSPEMIVGELPPADYHTKVGSKIIVSKSGINGNPRKATAKKGEVIVTRIVDYLVKWITSPVGSIAA